MPCYEIRIMSVEFKAQHLDLLKEAAEKLGWACQVDGSKVTIYPSNWGTIRIDLGAQKAEIPSNLQGKLNELKRAYSSAAIDRVAKLNMWAKKGTATAGTLLKF